MNCEKQTRKGGFDRQLLLHSAAFILQLLLYFLDVMMVLIVLLMTLFMAVMMMTVARTANVTWKKLTGRISTMLTQHTTAGIFSIDVNRHHVMLMTTMLLSSVTSKKVEQQAGQHAGGSYYVIHSKHSISATVQCTTLQCNSACYIPLRDM